MAKLYIAYNGSGIAAAPASVATGTSIKTLLQVATPSTTGIKVVEWGISFDGSTAAQPVKCELVDTGAVGATSGTSFTPQAYDDPNAVSSLCVGGTGATCYSPSAEGTVTATRHGDLQLVAPTNQWVKQWPLGREFQVAASKFLRVRVTAAATVNAYAYVIWEE
jgi:hypothetical protein